MFFLAGLSLKALMEAKEKNMLPVSFRKELNLF
jgi:hypothetical protein